jgi:predicted DNA-binding protein (MmcQ/YjbR family)
MAGRTERHVDKSDIYSKVKAHCFAKPDVTEEHPWGDVAFKRKGKAFVFTSEGSARFTLKSTPEKQASLTLHPQIEVAAYVGRFGWITIEVIDEDTLGLALDLIDESYESVGKRSGH